jgi:AGCS family alanine or glycine:cation symporter
MTQANSIANAVEASANIPTWITGAVVAALAFIVIIGGIKSIGSVAGKIVPAMALGYVLVAIVMLVMHAEHVPAAFMQIFTYAFGLEQAGGGVAGYAVLQAVRFGVARGLFSNEAGQGSTAIAHAAAKTNDPVAQGEIAMLGAFIDTIVICTMTALVILAVPGVFPGADGGTVEYAWQSTLQGPQVTTAVFGHALPDVTLFGTVISPGGIFIALALALFAFTTIIGWSYYMEQAATYLFGDWIAKPMRYVWVAMVFIGALTQIDFVWKFGDIANASMAFPNLIAILLLSPVVIAMAKEKGRL